VLELGCGTGLATRLWKDHATQVIGIEPNDDMRHTAQVQAEASSITYQSGYGHDTGLPDSCADIVMAAHSLHWMEPESTVAEIERFLRLGGVFAQIDFKWPMTMDSKTESAIRSAKRRCTAIVDALKLRGVRRYSTAHHLELIRSSDTFRYTNEIVLNRIMRGNADQIVGLLKTDADFQRALKDGVSDDDLGLTEFRQIAECVIGGGMKLWFLNFRVRLTVR
jgi:ubiquinone/menaquinone biosynthesis C-methylase UbiE